jgi:hypothetical protein
VPRAGKKSAVVWLAEFKADEISVEQLQCLVDQFADLKMRKKSDKGKEGEGQKSERPEGSEEGEVRG